VHPFFIIEKFQVFNPKKSIFTITKNFPFLPQKIPTIFTIPTQSFQALSPLIAVVAPILYALFEIVTKVKTGYGGEVAILSTAFFPLLNSLGTLIFIR
jgi:hypothetical protein